MELRALDGMSNMLTQHRPKLVIEFHSGVSRSLMLKLLSSVGYQLPGLPIEPVTGEAEAAYHDDRSYSFESRPA
jgi:hypothetical protein